MIVIIPIHNQRHNLPYVLNAYLAQTNAPKHIVLVLDRCTDDSRESAELMVSKFDTVGCTLHIVDKAADRTVGFGAGSTRDYGIRYALDAGLEGDFLFSDGDCIPSADLVRHHEEALVSDLPRITCGLRYETVPAGQPQDFPLVGDYVCGMPVQTDLRLEADYCRGQVFGTNYDRVVVNPDIIRNSWICWSCNLGMNRAAIELCHTVNGTMDGDERRVFNSAFDGNWGGEDGFVGATVFHCGGEVVAVSSRSWVTHLWHERGHTNMEHMRLVLSKENRLIDMACDNLVPNDPTIYRSSGVYTFDGLGIDWLDKFNSIEPNSVQKKILEAAEGGNELFNLALCLLLTGLLKYQGAPATSSYVADRDVIDSTLQSLKWSIKRLKIGTRSQGYFLPETLTEGP